VGGCCGCMCACVLSHCHLFIYTHMHTYLHTHTHTSSHSRAHTQHTQNTQNTHSLSHTLTLTPPLILLTSNHSHFYAISLSVSPLLSPSKVNQGKSTYNELLEEICFKQSGVCTAQDKVGDSAIIIVSHCFHLVVAHCGVNLGEEVGW